MQDDSKVQDDRDYNVLYNYEFIEDYNEESESHSMYVQGICITGLCSVLLRFLCSP